MNGYRGWAPPAQRDNAAGERCTYDDECGEGLHCDPDLPNRACSAECEDSCPQRADSPIARCVMVEDVGPRCLTSCAAYNDCRELYACIERPLNGKTERASVCYPEPPEEEEDP